MLTNSSSTSDQQSYICPNRKITSLITVGIIIMKTILVLPLSLFVLYLGHRRWRRQCSNRTTSHSDIFTYHLAVNEQFWGLGSICFLYGSYCGNTVIMVLGICATSMTFFGEVLFHLLTCVERYLAVVHPVTYLTFRSSRGVSIRNISIGCAWLLCVGLPSFQIDVTGASVITSVLFFLVVAIIIITYCTVSVLLVLINPGPGDRRKEKGDQTKLRAFHTIAAITSVLWLWFAGLLVTAAVVKSSAVSESAGCVLVACVSWFNLPTSLVSPLLFLHRARKLSCGHSNPG